MIYFELLPAGETITANKYCQQLVELKKAIDEKRPIWPIAKEFFSIMTTPGHMLQNRPISHIYLTLHLLIIICFDRNLNGKKFKNVEDVKNHLDTFFNEKPRDFYESGIRKMVERWKWIAEHDGEYIID